MASTPSVISPAPSDANAVRFRGCSKPSSGAGWSSIGLAQSYPKALVDGFDLDDASIDLARDNARAAGLAA